MERREELVGYIRQSLKEDFDPATGELLAWLDSVTLLQLVLFIEERFGIALDMAHFEISNFNTIDSLLLALERAN